MGRAQIVAFHEPVMKERQKAAMMGAAGDADSFGDGLAAAARSIIADARRALVDPELTDAEAVHEVRKALKRWRALLRLLARPLGEQADQMRAEARELMRALSGARDAQSALDALTDLRKEGTKADVPFSATSMETISQRRLPSRTPPSRPALPRRCVRNCRAISITPRCRSSAGRSRRSISTPWPMG